MTEGGPVCCALCCWLTTLITSIILFACSFATLDINHVGLRYNTVSKSYDETEIFGPGRYFVGLGHSLVEFPTTYRQLSFPGDSSAITGRVGVGSTAVSVHVSVKVFYKLQIEKLPEIIKWFPSRNWNERYTNIVKNSVAVVLGSGHLTLEQFIKDRNYVAKMIGWTCNERLASVYGYVTSVYVGEIALGTSGHSSIDKMYLNQQISNRRAQTSQVEGMREEIEASTNRNVSAILAQEKELISDTYRTTNFTFAEYKAKGERMYLAAQGQGYRYLQTKLNFTQDELLKFIYYEKMGNIGSLNAGHEKMTFDTGTYRLV